MHTHNIMESIVEQLFFEFKKKYALTCDCQKCQSNILAITLNQIPARYVSTDEGEVLTKALYLDTQMKQDIIKELTNAAMKVAENPRH